MPTYRVWYRDNAEPLEFVTASRCNEEQILDRILAQENIGASPDQPGEQPAAPMSLQERIRTHHLAPVRYTEDESEMNTIE